jgi:hypothetical protein
MQTVTRRAHIRVVAPLGLFLLVVTGLTVAAARVPGVEVALAASARDVLRGQVWRLLTSGLIAERPVAASVVSFGLLASLTLVLCGRRTLWLSALAGNVGSALLAYLAIGAIRLAEPGSMAAEWRARDFGVSAISAAWLGAISATGWRARRSATARGAIASSCLGIGIFAYILHPGITLLASEHVTAFAIGALVAAARRGEAQAISNLAVARRALPRLSARVVPRRAARWIDPVAAAAVATTAVVVGGSILPSALASLGNELLMERAQTLRCAHGPVASAYGGVARMPALVTCQTRRNTLGWPQGSSTHRSLRR